AVGIVSEPAIGGIDHHVAIEASVTAASRQVVVCQRTKVTIDPVTANAHVTAYTRYTAIAYTTEGSSVVGCFVDERQTRLLAPTIVGSLNNIEPWALRDRSATAPINTVHV